MSRPDAAGTHGTASLLRYVSGAGRPVVVAVDHHRADHEGVSVAVASPAGVVALALDPDVAAILEDRFGDAAACVRPLDGAGPGFAPVVAAGVLAGADQHDERVVAAVDATGDHVHVTLRHRAPQSGAVRWGDRFVVEMPRTSTAGATVAGLVAEHGPGVVLATFEALAAESRAVAWRLLERGLPLADALELDRRLAARGPRPGRPRRR